MSNRLQHKVAVVSGIANGIGKETALRFAQEGAIVIGSDIDPARANETLAESARRGTALHSVAMVDMFDEQAVTGFMNRIAGEFGRIDILINAAAVVEFGPVEELPVASFRTTLTGEVDSVFIACKAAWPHLKVSGGAVVNFASVAAHIAVDVMFGVAHCAGKGAVRAMTRQLALEGAQHGIRANSISPGLIVTPATEPAIEGLPGFADVIKGKLMLKRYGRPEDIASGCVYLASDEASWITGTDLAIDGGMTAW